MGRILRFFAARREEGRRAGCRGDPRRVDRGPTHPGDLRCITWSSSSSCARSRTWTPSWGRPRATRRRASSTSTITARRGFSLTCCRSRRRSGSPVTPPRSTARQPGRQGGAQARGQRDDLRRAARADRQVPRLPRDAVGQGLRAHDAGHAGEAARSAEPAGARRCAPRSIWSARQIPNFYFHVTTAYNLLRQGGVEIGKSDYLGTLEFIEG